MTKLPPAATWEEIEAEVRKMAHSIPPSDLGSTRAIQEVTRYVLLKLQEERIEICAGLNYPLAAPT